MTESHRFGRVFAIALVLLVGLGAVQVGFSMSAMGVEPSWRIILVSRALFALSALAWLPVLHSIRARYPIAVHGWPRHLFSLTLALALLLLLQALLLPHLDRLVQGPLVIRGSWLTRAIGDFLVLALAIGVALVDQLQLSLRAQELEARELSARLAEARLQALGQQLHPHFLFNTLTMISVLVHKDPVAADAMLNRLADLLRATLHEPRHELPLREEMQLLERYLDIMRIRFGDRLTIETDVPPDLGSILVPAFVLQPLVENALEHGIAQRTGPARVRIAASARDWRLRLEVSDNGVGLPAEIAPDGIGLGNVRRRLEQLYGPDHRLHLASTDGGGTLAIIELPAWRRAP